MANIKEEFGSSTSITITSLNSLASAQYAGCQSSAVDNTSNKYFDALVTVTVAVGAGTIANDKCAYVYAYGSEDGTTYVLDGTADLIDGSDGTVTIGNPSNAKLIGIVAIPTQSYTYRGVFSVAHAFGGVLPRKWGIIVVNYSGIATAAAGNSASYTGIYYTSV
jgi:hypothetical protein